MASEPDEDLLEKARQDLRHLHGRYLHEMINSGAKGEREAAAHTARVKTIERVLVTLEEVEAQGSATISSPIEEECVQVSEARINTLKELSNTEDEGQDDLEGPGVY